MRIAAHVGNPDITGFIRKNGSLTTTSKLQGHGQLPLGESILQLEIQFEVLDSEPVHHGECAEVLKHPC
eukprot:6201318-Pyramimonas_sp.AAC.2